MHLLMLWISSFEKIFIKFTKDVKSSCLCYYNFFKLSFAHIRLNLSCIVLMIYIWIFWVGVKFHATRIWEIENFYLFKGIKGGVLRHLSYKGQSHRAQQAPYGRYKLKMQKY